MQKNKRFIDSIEVSDGDAVITLDDGSTLGGIISVSASSSVSGVSFAYLQAYIINEETVIPDDETTH
jgi:hypothetical protein